MFMGEGVICNIVNEKVKIVKSIKSQVRKIKFSPNSILMLGFSTDMITFPKNGKRIASEKLNFDLCHVSFFYCDVRYYQLLKKQFMVTIQLEFKTFSKDRK